MTCEHEHLKRRYDDAYYCDQCKITILPSYVAKTYLDIVEIALAAKIEIPWAIPLDAMR